MKDQQGFTFIEVMIVVVVVVPLLASIGSLGAVVTRTVDANDRSSEIVEHLRRTTQRIAQFVRPARLASVQVRATAQDVTDGRATAVGEWISPLDLEPRATVRFLAAEGLLSMNARLSTPPRQLVFDLEPGETANGLDDDGDGLIDEGELGYVSDLVQANLGRFEQCEFVLDGRVLRVTLRGAQRGAQGRVYRSTVRHSFYIRNN